MRIRIFQAFASNNSGSYTIVGSFRSAAAAEEVATLIGAVAQAHSAWFEQNQYAEDGESPLDAFAREHGLSEERPGREDAWPAHGDPPSVSAIGHQVLLHAPYTVTMPRLFGELFYKKGGRVDVEIDHAHEELAVEFQFWVPKLRFDDPEKSRRIDALEAELAPLLPALLVRDEYDKRPCIPHMFHAGFWGSRHLTVVMSKLVPGVASVRAVAERHGVSLGVRIFECAHGVTDPLASLRGSDRPWGRARVILWSIGADRVAALKAVREVRGCGLDEVKAAIEELPTEVLVDVDLAYAERAVLTLQQAGCDAERVFPTRTDTGET